MVVRVQNSLSGPAGVVPSNATLAATAQAGTVEVTAPGRAAYSAEVAVNNLTTLRVGTGRHRGDTPELVVGVPGAPWFVRWYTRFPALWDAGYGDAEARWVLRLGTSHGLMVRENSTRNIQVRLKGASLASATVAGGFSGVAPQLAQVLRIGVGYDGSTLEVRVYVTSAGETANISYTFANVAITGDTLGLTSYRFRDGVLLAMGATGTAVDQRRAQLRVWRPNIVPATGAYDQAMADAVALFQDEYGLTPVDGIIGPETGAALDLVVQEIQGTAVPPPTWVSHLAVDDQGFPGPAAPPGGSAAGVLTTTGVGVSHRRAAGAVTTPVGVGAAGAGTARRAGAAGATTVVGAGSAGATRRTGQAAGGTVVATHTHTSTRRAGDTRTGVGVSARTTGLKRGLGATQARIVLDADAVGPDTVRGSAAARVRVAAAVTGHKRAVGSAAGGVVFAGSAGDPGLPALSGTVSVVGGLSGGVAVVGRPAGAVRVRGRLAGAVRRV